MFMTNAKMMKESNEIIKLHAPSILKELGLSENDEILNRIVVSDKIGSSIPHGVCEAQISRKFFSSDSVYIKGSAKITIYPLTFLYYTSKDGSLKKIPFVVRLFESQLRRAIIFTLAHELRHYWQHETGEYEKNELQFLGMSVMPYQHRWCEKDANEFGRKYIKK